MQRRATWHPRPVRFSTVWPCAQDAHRAGTGLLADWLLTALIKIVTTYTQPGQRVLLLDPAPLVGPTATWSASATGNRSRRPYSGLLEAGWTVVRLGRGIQTLTTTARPDPFGATFGESTDESESGPSTASPVTNEHAGPSPDRHVGPDPVPAAHTPDRFDLIITAAEPRTLDRLRPTDWVRLLTPAGILAIITHGDCPGGRFVDPAGALVRATQRAGLHYQDRIALLRVSIRDGALVATGPGARDRFRGPSGSSPVSAQHIPAHDDLFIFAAGGAVDSEETSDG